jgi:hypothetical protein
LLLGNIEGMTITGWDQDGAARSLLVGGDDHSLGQTVRLYWLTARLSLV